MKVNRTLLVSDRDIRSTLNRLVPLIHCVWDAVGVALIIILVMEVGSLVVLELIPALKVRLVRGGVDLASRSPLFFSDRELQKIYRTEDVVSYREMLQETWGGSLRRMYEPFVELREAESHGSWVNVDADGLRTFLEQIPRSQVHGRIVIHLYGGSTTFGYGVKDGETIAAYLHAALEREKPGAFAVYNFGGGGYHSTNERVRFEQHVVARLVPAIAIFIDGLNDFNTLSEHDESSLSPFIREATDGKFLAGMARTIRLGSSTLMLAEKLMEKVMPLRVGGVGQLNRHAISEWQINRLMTNHQLVRGICEHMGIRSLFVIQPSPFSGSKEIPTPIPAHSLYSNDEIALFRDGYAALQRRLRDQGPEFLDVIWLGDLSIPDPEYVDSVHYSPAMNKAIADRLAVRVLRLLDERP